MGRQRVALRRDHMITCAEAGRQVRAGSDVRPSTNESVPLGLVEVAAGKGASVSDPGIDSEGYAKPSLKKCRPIAARNEDKKVFSGRL